MEIAMISFKMFLMLGVSVYASFKFVSFMESFKNEGTLEKPVRIRTNQDITNDRNETK